MSEDGGGANASSCWARIMFIRARPTKFYASFALKGSPIKTSKRCTPIPDSDQTIARCQHKKFRRRENGGGINHQWGVPNVPFYKELANQGLPPMLPVVAFSVGEEEPRGIDTKPLVGNPLARNTLSPSIPWPTKSLSLITGRMPKAQITECHSAG